MERTKPDDTDEPSPEGRAAEGGDEPSSGGGDGLRAERRRATERWFLRRGVPHFIDGYSAGRHVLTRAALFLALVFVVEMLSTFDPDREGWTEVGPFVGGVALLLASWVLVNRLRGRRPFQRPDTVGPVEVTVFVLAPALVPLLFHDDPVRHSIVIVGANLLILAAAYVVTSYGLVPLSRWALGHLVHQLGDLANFAARALPLMLLFATVLFLNAEFWQVASDLVAPFFAVVVGMLFAAGLVFVVLRVPRELDEVSHFSSWAEVDRLAAGSPLGSVARHHDDGEPPAVAPLRRRAWLNVGLVLVFSQGVQILLVSVLIGVFYLVFGLFAVREQTMLQWVSDQDLSVIAEWQVFGNQVVFTWELVRSAVLVAAFAGLQFTVSVLIDSTYRQEFFEDAVGEVHESLAVRACYLDELVDRPEAEPPAAA